MASPFECRSSWWGEPNRSLLFSTLLSSTGCLFVDLNSFCNASVSSLRSRRALSYVGIFLHIERYIENFVRKMTLSIDNTFIMHLYEFLRGYWWQKAKLFAWRLWSIYLDHSKVIYSKTTEAKLGINWYFIQNH